MKILHWISIHTTNFVDFVEQLHHVNDNYPEADPKDMRIEYTDTDNILVCFYREMTEQELAAQATYKKAEETYAYALYLQLKERFEK